MDINSLPANSRVLVDANIFIYYFGGLSSDCKSFLRRVASREVEASVTTIIIAEILHRRMMAEAVIKGLISPGQILKKLKANPALIATLTDYIVEVERLFISVPLRIIEVTTADIAHSHVLRQTHGLFVTDSINLACADRVGITDIVAHDADFARVPTLNIWEPTDL